MVYFRRFTVNGCVPTPRAANSDSGSSRARLSFTLICEFALMAIYILHGMELLSFNMLGLAMKLTLRASRGSVTLIGYIYTDAALVLDTC